MPRLFFSIPPNGSEGDFGEVGISCHQLQTLQQFHVVEILDIGIQPVELRWA